MNKLLKNEYFFSIFTKGFMVLLGLLESVLLARYLGAELRGELSYIYSIASTGFLITTFGIYTAYPFERKKRQQHRDVQYLIDDFMSQVIPLFIFYFLVFFLLAFLSFKKNSTIAYVMFLLPVLGFDKVITFVYLIEHPNKANLFEVLSNCLQCIFLFLAFLFFPRNVLYGVVYYAIGGIFRIIYYYKKLNIDFSIKQFKMKTLFEYMRFGFFPMLALLLTTLNYRLDVIMLKQYDFIALSSIGVYSIGIGLSEKALLIPDTVKNVLISKLAKGKDADEVAKVMRICFFASIVTAIAITVLSGLLVSVLYGTEYKGAEKVTYITIWGTIVMVFFKMVSQYNVIQHKQQYNVIFLGIAIFVNIIFNLILIPRFGIYGAAIATIIGHFISSIVFLIYFHKVSGMPFNKMIFIQKEDMQTLFQIIR